MTVKVRVRLTPRSGTDRIDAVETGVDSLALVKARVRAAPIGGEANAALERLLAQALRLPKTAVRVARGASARIKTVEIDGLDPGDCAVRLAAISRAAQDG